MSGVSGSHVESARLKALMDEAGLDAVVAVVPASVAFLSGYRCSFDTAFREYMVAASSSPRRVYPTFFVQPRHGEAALVVHASFAVTGAAMWGGRIHVYGEHASAPPAARASALAAQTRDLVVSASRTPVDSLAAAIVALTEERPRLGIEAAGLDGDELPQLRAALPGAAILDCSVLLRLVRMVKSAAGIEAQRRASRVAEEAFLGCAALALPGVSAAELVYEFRRAIALAGGDLEHFASIPGGVGLAVACPYELSPHDVLYVDVGCILDGAVSETGTTLAVGSAGGPWVDEHVAIYAAIAAAAATMTPGVRTSDVYATGRRALDGSPAHDAALQGHGLGAEPRELPFIGSLADAVLEDECVAEGGDIALEEGMVINLEATLSRHGDRSVGVERTFVIAASGAELVVPQDRRLPLVGGSA